MTVVTELKQYQQDVKGLPTIGSLLWFTISGRTVYPNGQREQVPVRVTRDQLEAWFHELGLDTAFLPPRS